MLRCSRRRSVNRLLRALADLESKALAGELPDSWQWILRTRLVFIKKKTGTKPRPVRVGEVLRRIIAKHCLHHLQERIRQSMLKKRQYGVSLPGGAEVLIHAREALEGAVRSSPSAGVWALIDVDLVNCFPSLEWATIEAAIAHEFPDCFAWTRWCHKVAADIFLPSGAKHQTKRGAEQGDPLASLQCGLVLARCVREAMAEVSRRKGLTQAGVFDFWFADDGQLICRAQDVDLVLECLDAALAKCGASRGEGSDVKSVVRLVGHPDAIDAFFSCDATGDWISERIRRTCKVAAPNSAIEVLGTMLGSDLDRNAQFTECLSKLEKLHGTLSSLDDPQVEMILGRACGDVSRVTHLLRTNGGFLDNSVVSKHDDVQRCFLENILAVDLDANSVQQAAAGVSDGGLGFRMASSCKEFAFIASCIEARPFVEDLFRQMSDCGVNIDNCMNTFDTKLQQSMDRLLDSVDESSAFSVHNLCEEAAVKAYDRLKALQEGRRPQRGAPVGDGHASGRLVAAAGAEDDEHPTWCNSARLQRGLAKIVDEHSMAQLREGFSQAGAEGMSDFK